VVSRTIYLMVTCARGSRRSEARHILISIFDEGDAHPLLPTTIAPTPPQLSSANLPEGLQNY